MGNLSEKCTALTGARLKKAKVIKGLTGKSESTGPRLVERGKEELGERVLAVQRDE